MTDGLTCKPVVPQPPPQLLGLPHRPVIDLNAKAAEESVVFRCLAGRRGRRGRRRGRWRGRGPAATDEPLGIDEAVRIGGHGTWGSTHRPSVCRTASATASLPAKTTQIQSKGTPTAGGPRGPGKTFTMSTHATPCVLSDQSAPHIGDSRFADTNRAGDAPPRPITDAAPRKPSFLN